MQFRLAAGLANLSLPPWIILLGHSMIHRNIHDNCWCCLQNWRPWLKVPRGGKANLHSCLWRKASHMLWNYCWTMWICSMSHILVVFSFYLQHFWHLLFTSGVDTKQILWQKPHSCYLVDSTQANKHILCSELSFFPLLPKEQQRGWGRNLGSGGNTQRWPGLCLLRSSVCSTLCTLTQRVKPSAHQI